VDANSYPYL